MAIITRRIILFDSVLYTVERVIPVYVHLLKAKYIPRLRDHDVHYVRSQ